MVWINVLLEITEESLLQPLYYCLGDSIRDEKATQNKVKTGLLSCGLVYTAFSAIVSGLASPRVTWMGQNATLHDATIDYIRLEVAGIVFGSLAKFLLLVMVMLELNAMIYMVLAVQMISSIGFDFGFASKLGLNLGALGIAYSSLVTNLILLVVSIVIVVKKLNLGHLRHWKSGYEFHWFKSWTRVGFYSGLDSLIRNVVYLIVVLRSMNILEEQGSYWVATTLVWNWLLVPILPLSDLIKQDIGSSISEPTKQKKHWKKIMPYMFFAALTLMIWAATYPGWTWFVVNVLNSNSDKSDMVMDLLRHLVPCYAVFVFGLILNGVFYGLGRTEFLAIKAIIGNVVIVALFTMFNNGILFSNNVFGVAAIFGTSLVMGAVTTLIMYMYLTRSQQQL